MHMINPLSIFKQNGLFWAMERVHLEQLHAVLSSGESVELSQAAAFDLGKDQEPDYTIKQDGEAHIPVSGYIMKRGNKWLDYFGVDYTSTERTARRIQSALVDDSVKSITLDIESPGGSVFGVQDLADLVYTARETKPVHARIEDMAASAAYWIAAQASTVSANPTAAVGSIGVYMVVDDTSGYYESLGVKTHVISSHELKGAGVPGSKITPAQLKNWQREIDDLTALFVSDVARGRGLSESAVRKSATGQVWYDQANTARGLVDEIRKLEAQSAKPDPKPSDDEEGEEGEEQENENQDSAALAVEDNNHHRRKKMDKEIKVLEDRATATDGKLDDLAKSVESLAASVQTACAAMVEVQEISNKTVSAQKTAMIKTAQAAGSITPAQLATVEEYAEFCGDDVAKFQSHLDTLGGGIRTEVVSDDEEEIPGPAAHPSIEGMTIAEKERCCAVDSIDLVRGKRLDASGKVVN